MSTLAVIQARMGSTRFPGKVLADLDGRPMLAHIIERVARARMVDAVVVATTTDAGDDAVADAANRLGALVTRGPTEDVLTRFVMAAGEHGGDVVVRITADCPLVDPQIIDRVVKARADHAVEYASNIDPATFPDGFDAEVMTAACLARVDADATLTHQREHVTAHIREHPLDYTRAHVAFDRDVSWMRLTVDVPRDLQRIAAILTAIGEGPPPGVRDVVSLLDTDAALGDQTGLPERNERYRAQRNAASRQETS